MSNRRIGSIMAKVKDSLIWGIAIIVSVILCGFVLLMSPIFYISGAMIGPYDEKEEWKGVQL